MARQDSSVLRSKYFRRERERQMVTGRLVSKKNGNCLSLYENLPSDVRRRRCGDLFHTFLDYSWTRLLLTFAFTYVTSWVLGAAAW